jgi:predicted nucleotidyltransferase
MRVVGTLAGGGMRTLGQVRTLPEGAQALLCECKRLIQSLLPGATVLLYGSRARGTADPESDWDLLVLTDQPLSRAGQERVLDAVFDFELEREVVLQVLFYAKGDWDTPLLRAMPLHREIDREGIVL